MKKYHLSCAALALALTVPVAFSEEAKKDDPYTGHTEFHLGPLTLGVSTEVTTTTSGGETHKRPYLGVVLRSLSPELCAQLNLPEGMGLNVDAVSKDSPAEKAGIKRFDVLKKFNDQLLCGDEQLDILVKAAGTGAKATLGIFRGGKEQNVDIVIGERTDAAPGKPSFTLNGAPTITIDKIEVKESGGIQDKLKEAQDKMNGIQGKQAEVQKQVDAAVRKAEEAAQKALGAREHGLVLNSGGDVQMYSFYPEEHHSSSNSMVITDGDGTVEMSETNGHGTLKITDPAGAVVATLALAEKMNLDAIPEKFRAKVKKALERMRASLKDTIKHESPADPSPKKFQPGNPPLVAPEAPKEKGST